MEQYPFIFSNEPSYRLQRHVAFWTFWWLFQGFLYSFIALNSLNAYAIRLAGSMIESLIYLTGHMFLSYSLMYFVTPRYLLKQQYLATAVWVILFFVLTAAISATLSYTAIAYVREDLFGIYLVPYSKIGPYQLYTSLMAGLRGAITVGGIATAIKLMKYWYLKEQRNIQLEKENAAVQMQILKAQIHPHFLFNTLNNIYSYTQNVAPVAGQLVMGLSDMLRYMLYECNQSSVPLSKEIKLLKDYCSLQQVRYDKHLDLQINIRGVEEQLFIAPLLLIPFLENCFKHGASNLVEQAWISLSIEVTQDQLKMKLVNSKPMEERITPGEKHGIGITNVRTRLALLYPHKHELTITNDPEVFIVNLSLHLERQLLHYKPLYADNKLSQYVTI